MISVANIIELHEQTVCDWHVSALNNPCPEGSLLWTVCQQHQFNFLLWHEEDIARSRDVSDAEIARVKRAIDSYNQKRNDWIEKVDDQIMATLQEQHVSPGDAASLNTETPGAAIDRLSILALRTYHLQEQLDRRDVDEAHRQGVRQKITICQLQLRELSGSLQELIDDLFAGRKRHRTYRQMKMYNDPALNPYLYRSSSSESIQA